MIGDEFDAYTAYVRALRGSEDGAIGDGSTRHVYLINDIVYKVDREFYEGTNVIEYSHILDNIPNLPDNVFHPETSLYSVGDTSVIAMEYIRGQEIAKCYCLPDEICDQFCMTGKEESLVDRFIGDTSGFNTIRTDSGDYFIIDAAS